MSLHHRLLGLLAVGTLSLAASAQVHLNEIYLNDAGTDDTEYIELKGAPGTPLTGYVIVYVEGDKSSATSTNPGILKGGWDLSALSIGPSGYFVLGDALVTPAPDLQIGATNTIENGSETFYLIQSANPAGITALLNTHVDSPLGSNTTLLATLGTIEDSVAVVDGGVLDITFDGALVIPAFGGTSDQNPYRCGDYPGAWDLVNGLAVDPTILPPPPHPYATPGAANENLCPPPPQPGTAYCFGDGVPSAFTAACPCANFGAVGNGCASSFNANGANLTAHGTVAADDVVLDGSGMNALGNCIFLKGDGDNPLAEVFGDGVRCATGILVRLRTKALNAGAASFPDSLDTITLSARGGTPVGSALTGYYTVYYRNAAAAFCPPATFNAANGYWITW
ncbi:MAG: hypothetical protein HZA53_17525 [Planctomycetes bacterium]|nr:hypothetical protein [Planctomycetota bacterium]